MPVYNTVKYRQRRAEAIKFLGARCVVCGTENDLEFDHIDPRTKLFAISERPTIDEVAFRSEIEKCQLLCRECHKRKSLSEYPKREHGTRAMYVRRGCRCELCVMANREYFRLYMQERRARK